jgi:glycogen operon protein
MSVSAQAGQPYPLGATVVKGGVNFSLYSRDATGVELVFFAREEDPKPASVVRFDPIVNRTYHYWHAFVPRILPGQLYGYRVVGPTAPEVGLRFDATKTLLDPYCKAVVVPKNYSRQAATEPGDNAATAMKCVVVDPAAYDWEGDQPLRLPAARTIWIDTALDAPEDISVWNEAPPVAGATYQAAERSVVMLYSSIRH